MIGLLQATSPCIQPHHLLEAAAKIKQKEYDSVFSVVRNHFFRWKEVLHKGRPLTIVDLLHFYLYCIFITAKMSLRIDNSPKLLRSYHVSIFSLSRLVILLTNLLLVESV